MKLLILLSFIFLFIFGKQFETLSNRAISYSSLDQDKSSISKSIEQGKEIYLQFCIQCHLANGKGTPRIIPPLDGSNWLTKKRTESIHAVKFGQSGLIKVNGNWYNNTMPPMGLTDEEVADVMNYIMNSWSNKQKKAVTVKEVQAVKN